MCKQAICPLACLLLWIAASPAIGEVILTFDELPFQPVDDLHYNGVTFDFKIDGTDSLDAFYHSFGPGTRNAIDDPSLTGNSAGILAMSFSTPTDVLSFGVALNTAEDLTPGFSVELFDAASQSLGTVAVDTTSAGGTTGFSEGQFTYSGEKVVRAVVDFSDSPSVFALDNLAFYVPEPGTSVLVVLALLTLASARLWMRFRQC